MLGDRMSDHRFVHVCTEGSTFKQQLHTKNGTPVLERLLGGKIRTGVRRKFFSPVHEMCTVRMLENIPACSHHSVTPDDVFHTARHWPTRKTCDKLLGDLSNGDLHDLSTTPLRLQRARSSCCDAAAESQHPAKLRGCKHKSERKRGKRSSSLISNRCCHVHAPLSDSSWCSNLQPRCTRHRHRCPSLVQDDRIGFSHVDWSSSHLWISHLSLQTA